MAARKSKQIVESKSKKITKVPTFQEIIAADEKLRMETAQAYQEHGLKDKIFTHHSTVQLFGLGDATSRNWFLAKQVASKKQESIRYSIQQMLRLKDDDVNSDTFGEERLVIQFFMHYRDYNNNQKTVDFEVGRLSSPTFITNTTGYSGTTGEPIGSEERLQGFKQIFSIPFSSELVKSLSPICSAKCSFVINTGARKCTVDSIDAFCQDFVSLSRSLTPRKKMEDGSIR
jgi:hypothetical protein